MFECYKKLVLWGALASSIVACGISIDIPEGGFSLSTQKDTDIDTDIDTNIDTNEAMITDSGVPELAPPREYSAVDLLLVVDDSGSMIEEQEMLATYIQLLINFLVNPLPSWSYPAVEDVRVAVVTSDMGLQWGGNAFDRSHWPESFVLGDNLCVTAPVGRNGAFVTSYTDTRIYDQSGNLIFGFEPGSVDIYEGVIPCDVSAVQCPSGWECYNIDEKGEGRCIDPQGFGLTQQCPEAPGDQSFMEWAHYKEELPMAAGCLANVGTSGCGIEQQLVAGAVALENHSDFLREEALLVVVHITDEEDCSLASSEIFDTRYFDYDSDYQSMLINLGCGRDNYQFLTPVAELKSRYEQLKGEEEGILFAAIVGVPQVDKCQGRGDQLLDCMNVALEPNPDGSSGGTVAEPGIRWGVDGDGMPTLGLSTYSVACERRNFQGDLITMAMSPPRFVEMVSAFGDMGYISSICNQDWHPAMKDIAQMIVTRIHGN